MAPKIILINPHFNNPRSNYDRSISVGLLSLASYLDQKQMTVKIIDGARQNNYLELIKKEIPSADFIGLSVMTTQLTGALAISKLAKELNKKATVIWGGPHPSFFPESTAAHPAIDAVVIREGEETLFELITKPKNLWTTIKGAAFRNDNGQIIVNPKRPLLKMQGLPPLKWELMPQEILEKLSVIPAHTSRGCPNRCAFCINAITQNSWRARPAEQVFDQLLTIKSKPYFSGKTMQIWDENFFVDLERAKKIVNFMIKNKINIPWETSARADYFKKGFIDDEFLAELKKADCQVLDIGGESGSPGMLQKIKKDITPEEIINAAKQCVKFGIIPHISFIAGIPGESWSDIRMTLDLIDRLFKISPEIQIGGPQFFRPYPGSAIYEECKNYGWHDPSSLEEWVKLAQKELSYLNSSDYPWLKNPTRIEALEAYSRFGANSLRFSMQLGIGANKILKFAFVLSCKLRWKLKFFYWPLDFIIARAYVTSKD